MTSSKTRHSIIVGVDGSEHSRHAVEWAAAEAKVRGARLEIVSCWEFPMLIGSEVIWTAAPHRDALIEAAAARANRVVQEANVVESGVDYTIITPEGRAGDELVRLAADADLLVVGSRGNGSAKELLLGSVSNLCAHHSTCPVVIIRAHG
jgi:nucleotide-binding universal stress UspA family protein